MAGENNGMLPAEGADQLTDFHGLLRIQAHGGLIQDQQLRRAAQGLGDTGPLAVAAAEVAQEAGRDLGEAAEGDDFLHMGADGLLFYFAQLADKAQVAGDRHFVVERGPFGQITDHPLAGGRIFLQVLSADPDFSGGGRQIAGDQVQEGGFAGAVAAQEADGFVFFDMKGDALQRCQGAVFFCYTLQLNQGGHLLNKRPNL